MPNKEIEAQYNELRKKYRLPEFRDINLEFEISDLEEASFLLRAIIRRIAEKLDFHTTMVEDILQPDTSKPYSMHESRFFDEQEKKSMNEVYKQLMILSRQSIEALLAGNEKEEASFINGFTNEWKKIKLKLLSYITRMKDAWKTESEAKEDLGYLG